MDSLAYCMKTPTPVGEMLMAEADGALFGAWFSGQKYFPLPQGWEEKETPLLKKAAQELACYFAGELKIFTVPMVPRGTEFQKRVWAQIAVIPHGMVRSYGSISEALFSSPRAVGTATGRNPLTIFIPCHRVVGKDGSLTGYAGGLDKKKVLLSLEKIDLEDEKTRAV